MSCRQIEILIACLVGVLGTISVAVAQGPARHSTAQPTQKSTQTPKTAEPAALRQGGFIQQLRAIPPAPAQILAEADERAFRLPARSQTQRSLHASPSPMSTPARQQSYNAQNRPSSNSQLGHSSSAAQSRRPADGPRMQSSSIQSLEHGELNLIPSTVAAQQLPPTYSELQNRPALSRRLRGEYGRMPAAAELESTGVGMSLPDQSKGADEEGVDSYSSAEPYADSNIVTASNESRPNSTTGPGRPRQSAYELGEPSPGADAPRNEAFDALTAESLQQAPRVSRVPLPRSIANRNAPIEAGQPQRINATPASVTPHLGGPRASNATLRSAVSEDRTIPEVSPHAARLSPNSLPDSLPNLLSTPDEPADEHADTLELPPLASPVGSGNAAADLQSPQATLPALPELADNRDDEQATRYEMPDVHDLSMPELPTSEMAMPSFDDVRPQVSPRDSSQTLKPSPHLPRAADKTANKTESAAPAPVGLPSASSSDRAPEVGRGLEMGRGLERGSATEQRLKMEAPRLSVVLNGPRDLPIGSPADYQIVVRNQDSIDLNGLILRLDIPAGVKVQTQQPTHGQFELEAATEGLTMVTWSFEHLAAGQTATAPMQLVAGSAKNFAVAMEWTLMPIAGSSPIAVRAPQLELALEGPAEVRFGEPNVYRLHIRNPGNAPAEKVAVRLTAERFGSSTAEIAHIAPGEEEVIDVELTFNERGSINIEAIAQEQTGLASQTAIAVAVRQAVVEAELLTAAVVYHSAPAQCRVRLSNRGDADARGMQAVLQLPEGAGLISAPTGAVLKGRGLTWPVDKLIAGSSEEFVVQFKLTAPGANSLSLQCSGPGSVDSTAQAVMHVEAITDLKLFVEAPTAPAPVGGEVVYELTLTNRGSKAATNVIVIAQFSDGIEPLRSEGQAARVVPGQALFETLPRLEAGETVNLKVIAQAAAAGSHRFRVEVRSDDSQVRLVQEESTQYLESASRIAAPMASGSSVR